MQFDSIARPTALELPVVFEADAGKPKEHKEADGEVGAEHWAKNG